MDFVWQQKGCPNATVARAALKDELAAFKDALSRARKLLRKPQDPEVKLPYLKSVVGKSTATVERAVAALVKAGRIEHRGSKKTGGYFAVR